MKRITEWGSVEIEERVPRRAPADIEDTEEIVRDTDTRQRRKPFERVTSSTGDTYQLATSNLFAANRRG